MKKTTKGLLMALCALLLVVATVFTTLAYLVDTNNIVTNTFTVGNVDIDIGETPVDPDTGETIPEETWVKENEYPLVPGETYTKNPTILVKPGSQESYLFVKLENGLDPLVKTSDIVNQMKNNGWTLVPGQTKIYYYKETVAGEAKVADAKDKEIPVFNSITIDSATTGEQLEEVDGKEIIVNGYAIQVSDNFTSASDAWTALYNQLNN